MKQLWRSGLALALAAALLGSVEAARTQAAPVAGHDLTPARDLRGTWVSSLRGKGYQVTGRIDVPGSGWGDLTETADLRLVLTRASGNRVYGTIRFSNMSTTAVLHVPSPAGGFVTSPPQKIGSDRGGETRPVIATVSSSRITFRPVVVNGVTYKLNGNFTSDLMSGPMTKTYGTEGLAGLAGTIVRPLGGKFHLMRAR